MLFPPPPALGVQPSPQGRCRRRLRAARGAAGSLVSSHLPSHSGVNTSTMAEQLHLMNKGSSMEGVTDRGNLPLTAAADKGNAVSRFHGSNQKQKKLQCSSKNVFSVGYDESLFSSLVPPSLTRTCHHCGLFGFLRCSQCKQVYYCSADCQKKDWRAHSVVCEPVKQNVSNNNGDKLPTETEKRVYVKGDSASVDSLKTEEHKKVMLSDLQSLGIKKAMEVQGTVTEFKSPREFYMQMNSPEVVDHFSKLSVKLQDCYANAVIKEQYVAIKGEVCIAKCSSDQTWNRALVKDVDVLQKKARVFYIDYGNEENIPLSCIKALHKDTELLFPPCAIKCSFANYDQKKKGWNEGTTSFSSQLMGEQCSVIVVDVLQEETMPSFAVDVIHPNFGNCLDKVPSEMGSDLTPRSNAKGPCSSGASENHSKGGKEEIAQDEDFLRCANSVAECVSVLVGDTFSGVVPSVQNPENFFCQRMDSACQLAELQASLKAHCDKIPSSPAFHPAAGNLCCAQFTEDNLWYRAAVVAYVSEDNVLAGYIDYGNFEVLPVTRLRPMIPRLMDLPAQAIRCTLAGVKPPSEAWTSEAVSLMKRLVKDKVFTVKVVDKESYRLVVELIDASVTPVMNVSNYLIEKGCAVEESGMALPAVGMNDVKQAEEDTANKKIFKWSKLTLKQTVDVVVCTVYSPGEFYCQMVPNDNELFALNSLNKSLSEYCQNTPPNIFKPKHGETCCAFFPDDGNWYRALVRNMTSSGTVKVFFVDYGNVEEVPLDKIRQISSSFLKLPFQGIKCFLSGVNPGNNKWIPEATARFRELIAGITLQARVNSLSRDGAGVELVDNSTGHPKVINEILASEKLAVKEVLPDKNNFPNKSVNKKETSPGHWKSIEFTVGETVHICVTEVVSPDLFYAVPAESKDQEKLGRQLIELEDYCQSCEKQLFKPKVGEACCARFSGDGRWYRALVLKASRSVVDVLYADYGSTETLPLSKVLPITDSYLKLPFQTIICSLAGIEKADWSSSLLDRLKEMLLNKYVTITVKEINGNVNSVIVEKPCENGSVNVVDKLVMEGLVKSCRAESLHTEHQGSGGETKCCCAELKMQLKKHEQILLFLLNKYGNPDGFTEMKKLLEH
ncbi:tudor domain-containing protein 1 [Cuculus canorus]|uniref:tudor domain-containing protein 1 n=1 Tax=Cuculus canorus TaxID=55661 RepID=UPI0023AA78E0|nr:tudor domain-containing protein 1 [Cuculus canorus]